LTPSPDELAERARLQTLHLLRRAAEHYGIPAPRVEIRFDLRGRAAGQVRLPARGRPVIRYNPLLLAQNDTDFLGRTVPHEAAHVVAFRLHGRRIRPHGPEWKAVMGLFGADSARCHDYDLSAIPSRRFARHPYRCGCREHALTSIRHNRVLAGQVYLCRACGQELRPKSPAP
jgi:SprT protein